jgi:hypothetical protein
MHKSKLIAVLRTLSSNELRWFGAYIQSPFFNRNKKVTALFSVLKKHHPDFPEQKVAMEKVFPKVFPREKLDEQKLRYVMTDLAQLLEDFLSYQEYDKDEVYKKHLLLNTYDKRGLDKYFNGTMEDVQQAQEKNPYRDWNYFFNQHLLEYDSYLHQLSRQQRAISTSLQNVVDNLDLYYLSNRLRFNCAIMTRQHWLQEEYNNLFLGEILSFLSKTNLENIPSVSIYYEITMLYIEFREEKHYKKLISLLEKYGRFFHQDELQDMYTHALTYCSRQINQGNLNYLNEMLELYKKLIDKEILYEKGFISPQNFKNIVALALRVGQLDWTEKFITKYRERVQADYRENNYAYNMAYYLHAKGDYSKALKLMQTAELNDVYFHLDSKVLLLKTYYELDEQEPFFSLADAFTNYLKRNKLISDSSRESFLNFIRFSKKLIQVRLGGRTSAEGVAKEMKKVTSIASRQWLEEKLIEHQNVSRK